VGILQEAHVFLVNTVPSYVDFLTYAYDECLRTTALSGFYDDCGFPKAVHDEELGLGYTREDGTPVYASGLWIYRERLKRAAYVNSQDRRLNLISDKQHWMGHWCLPAYGFMGVWAPCEGGYENPYDDRDHLDWYGSMDRYAACSPARQFGQIPAVGMGARYRRGTPEMYARDTRCIVMLTYLNDQDVGSFGERDPRVVCGLRHARNLIRPWEEDVAFKGYWENSDWVRCDSTNVLISLYRRPDGVLFVLGNVGRQPVTATVTPRWSRLKLVSQSCRGSEGAAPRPAPACRGEAKRRRAGRGSAAAPPRMTDRLLKLNPAGLRAVNAESGEPLELEGGWRRPARFEVSVPPHDLRLVLVAAEGRYCRRD
jgi:hypothetical protein